MARLSQYRDQRLAVLTEISERVRRHSKVPTVRELAERFDISAATMHSWLTRLAEEGLVEWTPGRHRSLRCTPRAIQLLSSQDERSA
jgi:DNA-binding IclR family transcriptional regulator